MFCKIGAQQVLPAAPLNYESASPYRGEQLTAAFSCVLVAAFVGP